MNKKEMEKYKKLLLEERLNITGEVNKISEENLKKSRRDSSGDLSGYSFHMADMATDNYDREFSLGIADGERLTLSKIDEALKRMKESTYGKCEGCGKAITRKRLNAVPHAENCKACQEKEETKTGTEAEEGE
ncbi:MAG: TraR/DksA C4-type zinc finger protein [Candidatus Omnitrophota bacterium]